MPSLELPGFKRISVVVNNKPAAVGILNGWESKGVMHVKIVSDADDMFTVEGYAPKSHSVIWTPNAPRLT